MLPVQIAIFGWFLWITSIPAHRIVEGQAELVEPTLPPIPQEEQFTINRLPIEFLVEQGAPALVDGNTHWFCVKIRLLPEDGGDKYAVLARRLGDSTKQVYRMELTPDDDKGDAEAIDGSTSYTLQLEADESVKQSPYRDAHAQAFILTRHPDEDGLCKRLGGVYTRFADLQAYIHERFMQKSGGDKSQDEARTARDMLEAHIQRWNKRWARPASPDGPPNLCKAEKDCAGHHVSYVRVPADLQQKFQDRLFANWDTFFETHGAGIAGTTGAHFAAGNRGYRFPDYGRELMDKLFPDKEDMERFEESLSSVVMARRDIQQKFGTRIQVDFQHRLWRYGPDFPLSGGLWHRDTCPFGIGGGVPTGGWQLTSVYVFFAENMNLSTSGTRLKDRYGITHDMPCVPGTANIMRSGENDPHSPWHAGPILKKVNDSLPAFRVMLQSKMVLRKAAHAPPANAEAWGALGFSELPRVPLEMEEATLIAFFRNFSQALAWGASASNAVGSEAYPIAAQRAWSRTEEMADYLGFRGGFLPTFAKPPTDVEDANREAPSEQEPLDTTPPDCG